MNCSCSAPPIVWISLNAHFDIFKALTQENIGTIAYRNNVMRPEGLLIMETINKVFELIFIDNSHGRHLTYPK